MLCHSGLSWIDSLSRSYHRFEEIGLVFAVTSGSLSLTCADVDLSHLCDGYILLEQVLSSTPLDLRCCQ